MNQEHRQLVDCMLKIIYADDYVPSEQQKLEMLADCEYIRKYPFPSDINLSDSIRISSLDDLIAELIHYFLYLKTLQNI